ncbi:MAG: hypothetical protein GWM92_02690 [Gemmatimonadetes bacterium]|nr:hypothetical protein [Gemmatimonadota bacterium]NIR79377.1 hypothetical protein [Gemmatimonadota bacterium]NIT85927.1 hypothetical protein [Gemmatimonadota bacterium]NIU29752.1 hypothetical protein [Gemmatimonadota bacterium]NIU36501.1 hypothetical protein [Gemmatimonadota bacterium]
METETTRRDLAAIRALMEESRAHVSGTGRYWILWGVVSIFGFVVTWLGARGAVRLPLDLSWIWGGLLALGWAGSAWMGWRGERAAAVVNEVTRIVYAIWVGLGVVLTVGALAGMITPLISVEALPGLLAVTVGAGYLPTGSIRGLGWLRWLAGVWWAGGAWMLLRPGLHTLLVLGAMVVALQIVPGIVLERSGAPGRSSPARGTP